MGLASFISSSIVLTIDLFLPINKWPSEKSGTIGTKSRMGRAEAKLTVCPDSFNYNWYCDFFTIKT